MTNLVRQERRISISQLQDYRGILVYLSSNSAVLLRTLGRSLSSKGVTTWREDGSWLVNRSLPLFSRGSQSKFQTSLTDSSEYPLFLIYP